MHNPILAIVVPAYNEELVLNETAKRLDRVLNDLIKSCKISERSFILFVDDGSQDRTWEIISALHQASLCARGLKLSTNFGHQNALLAGLLSVKDKVDCAISIDADLQQDEKAMFDFIDKFREGYDIVYGVRKDRKSDRFTKKMFSLFFYDLMMLMGVPLIRNHADYRLVGRKVLNAVSEYKEVNLFLRGIFSGLGFKSTIVNFESRDRFSGKSKYSLKVMLSFALNGITSFSIVPIRLISLIGFIISIFSASMIGYTLLAYFSGWTVAGWPSMVVAVYFLGGIQLLSLGLIGEYIGKIYLEVKRRPQFIIDEEI